MKNTRILGINGSPNNTGATSILLGRSLYAAKKEGASISKLNLSSLNFSFDPKNPSKETIDEISSLFQENDGFIFASPIYWGNCSSLMKSFIEHLTYFEEKDFQLEGKVAGFISCGDTDGGIQVCFSMAAPLNHIGFIFPPYSFYHYNKNLVDSAENAWMENDAYLLGENIVELVELVKKKSPSWDYK